MRKYMILETVRMRGGRTDGQLQSLGGATPKAYPGRATMTVSELAPVEAARLERAPDFSIAPSMPTMLIRPMVRGGGTAAAWVPAEPADASGHDREDAWGLEAVGAAASAATGAGVRVAVLDTGIDAAHVAFKGVSIIQCDFSDDCDGDRQGHGTHCAGTILGRDVDGVRIGVARGVSELLVGKVLKDDGSGGSEMIFEAMRWAVAQKADVVSMSLGFDFPGMAKRLQDEGWPADLATSEVLDAYRANLRVFDQLMGLFRTMGPFGGGPVVVAAAGNESRRDVDARYRIAKSLPAATLDVLSVAACDDASPRGIASFSNGSPDVTAPGVDVLSAAAGAAPGP